jgi:hypothetical protein
MQLIPCIFPPIYRVSIRTYFNSLSSCRGPGQKGNWIESTCPTKRVERDVSVPTLLLPRYSSAPPTPLPPPRGRNIASLPSSPRGDSRHTRSSFLQLSALIVQLLLENINTQDFFDQESFIVDFCSRTCYILTKGDSTRTRFSVPSLSSVIGMKNGRNKFPSWKRFFFVSKLVVSMNIIKVSLKNKQFFHGLAS